MGGDCNPNMPAYLSPAAVGHVSRWFALPWCADSRAVAQATLPAPPDSKGAACAGEEAECGDKKKAPIKMATRNLLAFPATARAVGCCVGKVRHSHSDDAPSAARAAGAEDLL